MRRLGLVLMTLLFVTPRGFAADDWLWKSVEAAEKTRRERKEAEKRAKEEAKENAPPIQSSLTEMPGSTVSRRRQKWWQIQIDFLSPKDAFDSEEALKDLTSHFAGKQEGTFSGSTETDAQPLISLGLMFPVRKNFDMGWAIG